MRLLFLITLLLSQSCINETKKLPIYGRSEIIPKEVNEKIINDTLHHKIKDFSFYNQDSLLVTNNTFKNSIYITDFFFTSCPTICPIMKSNLLKVYNSFKNNNKVKFLSHTINPEFDTVEILNQYSQKLGVNSSIWHFVTGEYSTLYDLAQTSYMVSALKDENEPGGFLHSGTFLLIDTNRHIRGIYDGTSDLEINRLIQDINTLLNSISE